MADTKITALAVITTVDPANDVLPIVDVSDTSMAASGTTKKITTNQILGASGTATLASATITGNLTVDTNTLFVDAATNRVCVGTTTPGIGNNASTAFSVAGGVSTYSSFRASGGEEMNLFAAPGITGLWAFTNTPLTFGSNNTELMRLNSTGLGVGVSPAVLLDVQSASAVIRATSSTGTNTSFAAFANTGGAVRVGAENSAGGGLFTGSSAYSAVLGTTGAYSAHIATSGAVRMTVDSSGNVGIGVTPSASHILSCAGPIGISGTNLGTRTSYISNSGACAIYYTDGGGSGYFTDFGNLIIQPRTSAARSVVIATGSTTPVERAVVKSTGQVRFVPLASDPAGAEAGDVYYNSTSNKLKCYNGTTWNDLF